MAAVYTVAKKSDSFLFAGSSRTGQCMCAGRVIICFFLEQLGEILGLFPKSHLLGHVLHLVQTL